MRTDPVDLAVDLNTVDDSALPWTSSTMPADHPRCRRATTCWLASGAALPVALVVDVTDRIVHVRPLRGSVAGGRRPARGRSSKAS